METLRIGTLHEFLSIAFPDGVSGEGWIATRAEIVVDGFRGEIRPWFRLEDFERFERELRSLYEQLKGEANLEPMEGQLTVKLKAGTGGHIELAGEAFSNATYGNRLKFEIAMDQTWLADTIRTLQKNRETTAPSMHQE